MPNYPSSSTLTPLDTIIINITDALNDALNDAEFDVDYKGLFTIAKALYTTFGIYKGIKIWKDSEGSALARPAVRLLTLNAVLVALITLYKLTRREIAPLFVLHCLGGYSSFLVFLTLSGFGTHPKIKKGKRGDRRISLAIWVGHVLHLAALIVGYQYAECSVHEVYPNVSIGATSPSFLAT